MGLKETEIYLLLLTLLVSMVNLNSGRSNVLQEMVHLVLLFTYIVLIFE